VEAYLAEHGQAATAAPAETETAKAQAKTASPADNGNADNVTPLLMPQAGNSMEEGTIVEWKVAEGDTVDVGQVLYEVETDKATVEIEADQAGRLARIVAGPGDVIPVKQPVAYLADNDADVEAYLAEHGQAATAAPAETETAKSQAKTASPAGGASSQPAPAAPASSAGGRVKASPYARKLARQRGVDLSAVATGQGPGGRIIAADVQAAQPAGAPAAPASAAPAAPQRVGPDEVTRQPLSKMRKAIGTALQRSKQTVPHFYLRCKVDAQPLLDFYAGEKAKYKCSLNDVITLAVGRTLAEFPSFRSRIEGDQLVTLPTANIGIAVGTDEGLVVPVVMAVDRMNLAQLAGETKRVVTAARGGKIEGLGQGVMTISNLGMFGVDEFSAIINPPEAAILAVSAAVEEVIVSGGAMRPGKTMTLTLSCDHRVVDGLAAAKFAARLKEVLAWPGVMLQ
jgi:pyruvate dehydrogenase E2 component (dihydrolipoamide acetyltransferase)